MRQQKQVRDRNKLKDQSLGLEKILRDDLQKNLFRALRILAVGFFSWKTNNLKTDKETLKRVCDSCIHFLYRLLFILYAESRKFLPLENKHYRDQLSLESIIKFIAIEHPPPQFEKFENRYLKRLKFLFSLINEGNAKIENTNKEISIPSYAGELFEPKANPFLENLDISDHYLLQTIRFLTIKETEKKRTRFDYTSLKIRQLGAIYEELLEYRLEIAQEDFVEVERGKKIAIIPKNKYRKKKGQLVQEIPYGSMVITDDSAKRKSAGAYYTPEIIVKVITEKTIGPVVEEKVEKAFQQGKDPIQAILNLRILDPAMGSGHFLLEVINFLANKIIEIKNKLPDKKNDLNFSHAKRLVADRCIYGVDINPLAVELSKLSLWLSTISKDESLLFLNNHLKTGDSLIGDRPEKHLEPNEDPCALVENIVSQYPVFQWNLEFSDVFNLEKPGFDAIIGNPPFIFSRSGKITEQWREYYFAHYSTLKDKPNTYTMFIEQSINLLKNGGRLGFVLPNSWLAIPSGEPLRNFLLENT
ncbi:MAG: class I SAM-dependent DNA methyltransferase, partial [Candidatus Hodarchaeota archaeon]